MANVHKAMMSNAYCSLSLLESMLVAFPALVKLPEAPSHVAQTIAQTPTTVEISVHIITSDEGRHVGNIVASPEVFLVRESRRALPGLGMHSRIS